MFIPQESLGIRRKIRYVSGQRQKAEGFTLRLHCSVVYEIFFSETFQNIHSPPSQRHGVKDLRPI